MRRGSSMGRRRGAGIGAVLLTILLMIGMLTATVFADESDRMPALDSSAEPSLTVHMTYTDPNLETDNVKPMAGVEVKLVQVASLTVNGGSADYTLLPAYGESGVTLAGMTTSESISAAQTLKALVPDGDADSGLTDGDGKVTFSDLPAGMYLVYQDDGANTDYRVDEISTMLIAVPYPNVSADGNSWQYAVEIEPKVELTGPLNNGKITVTKTIYNTETEQSYNPPEGEALTFYVGLFYDEDCTDQVAGTTDEKLTFRDSGTAEAVFENLVTDETYYIAETDGQGNVVPKATVNTVTFTPEYPDGQAVSITRQENEGEIAFRNVTTGLPDGYYYGGTITITKKAAESDGSEKTMDRTFYAGIFADAAFTQPVADVVELKLDGKSSVSVPIAVNIGTSIRDEATFYITETDANGKPLENSDEFTISSDPQDGKVTLKAKDAKDAEIVITNTFAEEKQPPESKPESKPEQKPGSKTTKSTKTGDNSNALLWIVVLIAAAAVVLFLDRRRKSKK
ncbi:MAG: LPXTG cell wall anchor domain-containing protein [Lachnospiraceae bacterium]|nr:LPXTG cell wall anchor domain-containing protein [Lachnospiraceae bacterium]